MIMLKYILLLVLSPILIGCSTQGKIISMYSPYKDLSTLKIDDILHLSTGSLIEKDQLFKNLASSRIIYVGETHDNINAHKMQLEILKAMYKQAPGKIAVGMEMLKNSSQQQADDWANGKLAEKEWFATWTKNWSNEYGLYADILSFIRDNNIPLIALRASDDQMMQVRNSFSKKRCPYKTPQNCQRWILMTHTIGPT